MVDSQSSVRFIKRKSSYNLPRFPHSEVCSHPLARVLRIPSALRTKEMVAQIVTVTSEIKLFREMRESLSPQAHWQCCEAMECAEFEAGQVAVI